MIELLDYGILEFFQNLHNSVLTSVYRFFTVIGEAGAVWILIALILLCAKSTRKYGAILAVALLLCLILGNGVLKNVLSRPRPCWRHPEVELLIGIPRDYSFPSGHTLSSFASATVLFYWNKRVGIAAFVMAFLIATSRLYFYVHYPTDVIGGIVFGIIIALVSIWLIKKCWKQKEML